MVQLPEDSQLPDRKLIEELLKQHLEEPGEDMGTMKLNFGMAEDVLVLGLAGAFMHNLDYVDDPLFLQAINATIGETYADGEPVPERDKIHKKIPMTISGYVLLDGDGNLSGFACFMSQLPKE